MYAATSGNPAATPADVYNNASKPNAVALDLNKRRYSVTWNTTNAPTHGPDITVNIPPQSGLFVGKPGTAEVIVNHKQRRYFSTIFGSADIEMHWRAVAQGKWVAGKMGILVLNPSAPGALTDTGGGRLSVVG